MCGRFTLFARLNLLLQEFSFDTGPLLRERFNIVPSQDVSVIRQSDGKRELTQMQWGFVPSWANDVKISPINAKSETVADKNFFRGAIKKRRCLIPADGFYEWKKKPKKIKGDPPWYFQVHGGQPFAFAGIWERWEKGAEPIESCAILTTTPNELMAPLHDRLAVILSPADYDLWLDPTMNDPAKLTYLYEPFPTNEMSMYRVSAYVNKPENQGPACIEPLAE